MKLSYSSLLLLAGMLFLCTLALPAQSDSLKAQVANFKTKHQEKHQLKYLNIEQRELGGLDDTEPAYRDRFMLESKEEYENSLGYTTERDVYFDVLGYASVRDRQYALEYWMEEFIEGAKLRPARPIRKLRYAVPTIILINPQSIIVCSFDCKFYTEAHFDHWKTQIWESFATDQEKSMLLEVQCDGPVAWTKNPPDPKARGLF